MAKNAKESAQLKSRTTKLSKKSVGELVDIILRKDKIERNLNAQIKKFKGEIDALTTRVKNFDNDMEGTYQSLETYKAKYEEVSKNLELTDGSRREFEQACHNAIKDMHAANDRAKRWKIIAICACAAFIISVIINLIMA